MKVTSYAVARPAYYDRNATSSYNQYSGVVGPHAETTRWTVTIAAGKKMLVEQIGITYFNVSVATVAGSYASNIFIVGQYLASQGSSVNVVATQGALYLTGNITLYAGETMYATTYNYATGGTVAHSMTYKATQFDT